jgi:hypothetical protein
MTADRLTTCPDEACQGVVKRLIGTGAGLLFKGSGFYITDYRSDSYKAAAKSDSSTSGGSGKSETKKGDSGGSKGSGDKGSSKSPGTGTAKPSS